MRPRLWSERPDAVVMEGGDLHGVSTTFTHSSFLSLKML